MTTSELNGLLRQFIAQVSRLIKVLKATDLDEQATLEDELFSTEPSVAAVNHQKPTLSFSYQSVATVNDPLARELAAIRLPVAQLFSLAEQN